MTVIHTKKQDTNRDANYPPKAPKLVERLASQEINKIKQSTILKQDK